MVHGFSIEPTHLITAENGLRAGHVQRSSSMHVYGGRPPFAHKSSIELIYETTSNQQIKTASC
jgi:hypothetical protein